VIRLEWHSSPLAQLEGIFFVLWGAIRLAQLARLDLTSLSACRARNRQAAEC
jgi:hypothetical protein